MSINKATLLGNVCQDPKIVTFKNGERMAKFGLATNKRGFTTRDGRDVPEQTEFHNIIVPDNMVNAVTQCVKKGDKLYVEGEIHNHTYEDNGVKKNITEIRMTVMDLVAPKQTQQTTAAPQQTQQAKPEDLPF